MDFDPTKTFAELGINPDDVRAALIRHLSTPTPHPTIEDRATELVLYERCRRAGISSGHSLGLISNLDRADVVAIAELVEKGCDLKTAARIVL